MYFHHLKLSPVYIVLLLGPESTVSPLVDGQLAELMLPGLGSHCFPNETGRAGLAEVVSYVI